MKVDIIIIIIRAQVLCESRGGRHGLPVPNKPDEFCGRQATLKHHQSILSGPVLFYPVLCSAVRSCPVRSCPVLSGPVLSGPVLSGPARSPVPLAVTVVTEVTVVIPHGPSPASETVHLPPVTSSELRSCVKVDVDVLGSRP